MATGRPVAAALDIVEKRHGYVMTYEDPELAFVEDTMDISEGVRGHKGGPPLIVPKGGPLSVSYKVGPDGMPLDPAGLIDSIARAGSVHGLKFEYVQSDKDTFHVVAKAARDAKGAPAALRPALDTIVNLPEKDRNANDFLDELCRAIARARPGELFANAPGNLYHQRRVSRGAVNEVAREVLKSGLAKVGPKMSWQLLCGPGREGCALNVYPVTMAQE